MDVGADMADLISALEEESPVHRRAAVRVGQAASTPSADISMSDESAQGGLGVLSSAAAAVAGRGGRRDTIAVNWSRC